jgi:hypothetical protein
VKDSHNNPFFMQNQAGWAGYFFGLVRFNYSAGTAILTDGFSATFFWRSLMPQSRIPISQARADDTITRYLNDYRCPDCLLDWQDEWDCACHDRCPGCHKEIVPLHSEDIAL